MYHEKTIPGGMVFFANITDVVTRSRNIRGALGMVSKAINYEELYTKMLHGIIEVRGNNKEVCQYIFQNSDPTSITPFPEHIRRSLLEEYIVFLTGEKPEDGTYGDYLDNPEADGVKVLKAESIPLWKKIYDKWNSEDGDEAEILNQDDFTISAFNKMGNAIVTVIPMEDNKEAYLLAAHRNVSSSLIGKMIFINNECVFKYNRTKMKKTPDPVYAEGEFLVLSSDVDAAIYDGCCFVFNASNFNRVFKYEETQKKELENNSGKITSLGFLTDGENLLKLVKESRSLRRELLKTIANGRLERFQELSPTIIEERIKKNSELAIEFDAEHKIKVDEKSYKNVVGILSGRINIDLVFETLNGVA